MPMIERVLVSVSDKTGVVEFVRALAAMGIEVLSTGGTAATLRSGGVEVRDVSDYTGFPEIMGGRVKTLHPKIHGALLGRPDVDQAVMAEHGIAPIGMVVVNLYPFERTVADPDCDLATATENIGPVNVGVKRSRSSRLHAPPRTSSVVPVSATVRGEPPRRSTTLSRLWEKKPRRRLSGAQNG